MTEAPDLIEPPAAREPAEVLLLACAALTDGDLEAAVALYEPDATLCWGHGHSAAGHAAIRMVLAGVMDMRLPLRAQAVRVLRAGPLALITGERALTGTALDGVAVALTGPAALIARCQPDGTWLTAADQWLPYRTPGSEPRASFSRPRRLVPPSWRAAEILTAATAPLDPAGRGRTLHQLSLAGQDGRTIGPPPG